MTRSLKGCDFDWRPRAKGVAAKPTIVRQHFVDIERRRSHRRRRIKRLRQKHSAAHFKWRLLA